MEAAEPVVRVVRGHPTPAQLAALVAVLLSRPAPAHAPAPPRSRWGTANRPVPPGLRPGPGRWRGSGLPR